MENIKKVVKKVVNSFKKLIDKIVGAVKFFSSTVGMIVGLIIVVLVVVFILLYFVKVLEHALGKWLNADYAGVSTAGDYEYIVSSLGYTGYDSMITEKNWQEFMAYEYAVLMDVAEYLWEGQEKYTTENPDAYKDTVLGPYPAEYYAANNGVDYNDSKVSTTYAQSVKSDTNGGKNYLKGSGDEYLKVTGPAYMPYLPVTQKYNSAALTKEDWNYLVINGQHSARFAPSEPETPNAKFSKSSVIYGGNADVMPPTISYEFKSNPYEPDAGGSLVPYISVLKEQLQYFYFTVGNADKFQGIDDLSGGAKINEEDIEYVDLMEISQVLNVSNPYITQSTAWAQWWDNNTDKDPRYTTDAWVSADKEYEQNLYFTNMYSSVVYKTALQVMIDRYLPKASLLTSWYYLKDTDYASAETQGKETTIDLEQSESAFEIDELLNDIKAVYNYYCWIQDETVGNESKEVVVYNKEDGTVKRGDDGKAETETKSIPMASTNNDTFIHFGQAGIEANIFGVFKLYDPTGEHAIIPKPEAPTEITGDDEKKTVPVITDLLSKDAYFMDRFGFKVTFDYEYQYTYITTTPQYSPTPDGIDIILYPPHTSHVYQSYGKLRVCPSTTCSSCYNAYNKYSGWNVIDYDRDNSSQRVCITVYKTLIDANGNYVDPDSQSYVSGYTYSPEASTATATATIIVPYEATDDVSPRGDENSYKMDPISQYIHDQVILRAEEKIMDEVEALRKASDYEIEYQETEFINHGYWYPTKTYKKGSDIKASPLTFFDERYNRNLAFYDFTAFKDDKSLNKEKLATKFKEIINEILTNIDTYTTGEGPKDPYTGVTRAENVQSSELYDMLEEYLWKIYIENYENGGYDPDGNAYDTLAEAKANRGGTGLCPVPAPSVPNVGTDPQFQRVTAINSITVGKIAENESNCETTNLILLENGNLIETNVEPKDYNLKFTIANNFTSVSEQEAPYNAIYDIDDYVLSMTLAIQQKRIATMIVTDVEEWAKSANYTIEIMNNTFDYTNYRYVVPHSYLNFGVEKFHIEENPSYRTSYYKEYFSKIDKETAGIKEADVLTMMLKWEEFAEAGNETAYAYMRDLYKLIIYIRESQDVILESAYSYLYVPDTIWEFREGVSQEAFWSQRLAAEMPGMPDALTDDELNTVKVRKDEIEWQILNYDEYEECKDETGDKVKVYALFPHNSSYVRSYFMQSALGGTFDDGGYILQGHDSSDWLARAAIGNIIAGDCGIKDYEIRLRTARKILSENSTTGSFSDALAALKGSDTSSNYYKLAEQEVMDELNEYKVKSPIVSIAAGTVTRAQYDCYSGFSVAVVHSGSANTSYVHMRRWPNVQVGDIIGPGTQVGYEGTTGNSTGYHLHLNLWIGGKKASPAEYMAPLFAPFYNKEKVIESLVELQEEGNDLELVLASDYMELYRTILTYPIEQGMNKLLNGEFSYTGITYLQKCTLIEIDGEQYISYPKDKSSGISMYESGDGTVIVKLGSNQYYLCSIDRSSKTITSGDGDDAEEINCVKLNGEPQRIAFNEKSSLGSTRIKITDASYQDAEIIWGNNVPLQPLVDDMENLQDITSLNDQRLLDPQEATYSREYAQPSNDPPENIIYELFNSKKDVTAKDDFFDITKCTDKLKTPAWILSYLSDMDSAFAVPFYEGPISMEMQVQVDNGSRVLGYAGTASGDVLALEQALKMKGFAPGDALNMSGEFDEKLKAVLISASEKINDSLVTMFFSKGELGGNATAEAPFGDYGHQGVAYWNAYVTYGSTTAAAEVGKEAARLGATVAGLRPAFVMAVANCESSFIPTVDSFLFCSERQKLNFYTGEWDDGFVTTRGVDKVIRRAVGLMQIAPPGAISMAASKLGVEVNNQNIEQILRYLRNARTNATLGAEILVNMMNLIRQSYYDNLKASVNANITVFQQIEDATGVDKYELAMIGAATLMYNMGPAYTDKVIAALRSVEFYPDCLENLKYPGVGVNYAEQASRGYAIRCSDSYSGTGYWIGVMDYVAKDAYNTIKNLK